MVVSPATLRNAATWRGGLWLAALAVLLGGCAPAQYRGDSVTPARPRPVSPPELVVVASPAPIAAPLVQPFATPEPVVPSARLDPPTPAPPKPPQPRVTIVLDAGHGGRDPGAPATRISPLPEKAIVLAIADEVADRLRSQSTTIVMTRCSDCFIPLDDRAAMADRHIAGLFVSIHADAAPNHDAVGATLYVARQASSESRLAARCILAALAADHITTRGVRRSDFRVLVGHSRPAVLVECGYLTNRVDAALLNTGAYRSKIAAAIADGIADYLSKVSSRPTP